MSNDRHVEATTGSIRFSISLPPIPMNNEIRSVGAAKGVVYAFGTGAACIMIGALLCLFIIGAILGIPLIIMGLGFIVTCPWGYKYIVQADCPVCGTTIYIIKPLQRKRVMKCKSCKTMLEKGCGRLAKLGA